MTLLKELREKALKATPGPWAIENDHDDKIITYINGVKAIVAILVNEPDTSFIASANPTTVITLLDCLELAVKTIEFYADPHNIPIIDNVIEKYQNGTQLHSVRASWEHTGKFFSTAKEALAEIQEKLK